MFRILLIAILTQIPCLAFADTSTALSTCVADNTSGKQRKDLARWVFLAMAAHPDLRQYTSPETDVAREPTDRNVAELFEILITVQCETEANATFRELGTPGLQVAFEVLGRLAMQELMSNADASAAMSAFERYVDNDKISAALNKK
jgi:hypothetical protein